MNRLLTLIALILLAGCSGGSQSPLNLYTGDYVAPASGDPVALELELTAEAAGDNWRVVLSAPQAADLYQLAATLEYDAGRYAVLDAQAGGGLGGPADSYFVWGETESGAIDFAYTRRYYGAGVTGAVRLLDVLVNPQAEFNLSDFALSDHPDGLIARDSAKRDLPVTTARGTGQ